MAIFRFFLLAVGLILFFIFLTYLLNHFSKNNKYIKYFPGFLCIAASLYNFYLSKQASQGFQDIAAIIMGIFFLLGFISVLICGLFIDIVIPKINKKK